MAGTKEKVASALKQMMLTKNLDKISVDDIISCANVSRTSFYKNFQDKYEAAYYIYTSTIGERAIKRFSETKDFYLMCKDVWYGIAEDAAFYKNLFRASNANTNFFSWYSEYAITSHVNFYGELHMTDALRLQIKIYSLGTCAITERWLLGGMKESVDEMIDAVCLALPYELRKAIMKSNEKFRI